MPMREIRLTVRSLARTPLYTLTAVLSLALGIGATTAIFSMMDQVLMRTLPVKDPGRLAFIYHPGPLQGSSSTSEQGGPAFSYPMFREMQAQQTAFTGLAGSYQVSASAAYNNAAANVARAAGLGQLLPGARRRRGAGAGVRRRATIAKPAGIRSSSSPTPTGRRASAPIPGCSTRRWSSTGAR